jgi:hypothetical protein
MTRFSVGNEKLILWVGYVRIMRTPNMTKLQSGKDNPYHDRVMVRFQKNS